MSLTDKLKRALETTKPTSPADVARVLTKETERMFPGLWKLVDALRALPDDDWDSSRCVLPEIAVFRLVREVMGGDEPTSSVARYVDRVTATAGWRPSQDIIEIDGDVLAALLDTPCDKIPCEILSRLPAWSIYIPIPPNPAYDLRLGATPLVGVFAYYTDTTGTPDRKTGVFLNLLPVTNDVAGLPMCGAAIPIDLTSATIREAIEAPILARVSDDAYQSWMEEHKAEMDSCVEFAARLISVLLYVITETENTSATSDEIIITRPRAKRVKGGWRLFPPNKPHVITLGKEVGEQIRNGRSQERSYAETRKGPRPHIRRAHWHHYWTGSKQAGQTLVARWLPPIPVALAEDDGDGSERT